MSSAARCPSACDVNPSFGSIARSPGRSPGVTLLTSALRGPSGFESVKPSSDGALASTTTAATASIAHPSGETRRCLCLAGEDLGEHATTAQPDGNGPFTGGHGVMRMTALVRPALCL